MVNKSVILRKISLIRHNLSRLKGKENISLESFKNDLDIHDIILHNFQLAVQGYIAIENHIISDEGWGVASSLNEIFYILQNKGVTTQELLEEYPHLIKEDILAALSYSADVISREEQRC